MSQGIRTDPSLTDQRWSDQQWCELSVLASSFSVCNLKCSPFFKGILNLLKVCKHFSMFLLMNPEDYLSKCSKNPGGILLQFFLFMLRFRSLVFHFLSLLQEKTLRQTSKWNSSAVSPVVAISMLKQHEASWCHSWCRSSLQHSCLGPKLPGVEGSAAGQQNAATLWGCTAHCCFPAR